MNFLKGYKTIVFNTLVGVAGLAQLTGVITVVAPQFLPAVTLAVAIANVILRWATDTGIFQSTPTA